MAATVEESTPPDMAIAMVVLCDMGKKSRPISIFALIVLARDAAGWGAAPADRGFFWNTNPVRNLPRACPRKVFCFACGIHLKKCAH
jgi:hypothetical protein